MYTFIQSRIAFRFLPTCNRSPLRQMASPSPIFSHIHPCPIISQGIDSVHARESPALQEEGRQKTVPQNVNANTSHVTHHQSQNLLNYQPLKILWPIVL